MNTGYEEDLTEGRLYSVCDIDLDRMTVMVQNDVAKFRSFPAECFRINLLAGPSREEVEQVCAEARKFRLVCLKDASLSASQHFRSWMETMLRNLFEKQGIATDGWSCRKLITESRRVGVKGADLIHTWSKREERVNQWILDIPVTGLTHDDMERFERIRMRVGTRLRELVEGAEFPGTDL